MIPKEFLSEQLEVFGIPQPSEVVEKLDLFSDLLVEKNKVLNLTAITEPKEIAVKHFLDSLSVLKFVSFGQGESIIDVGTGAGFPSIPLMIARPDLKITMLDSTKKRLDFIEEVMDKLGLSGKTLHMRAEQAGKEKEYRENFDKAVSRAVAGMNRLCEYCLPFVKPGGEFIAMKGRGGSEELEEAAGAIKLLSAQEETQNRFNLPGSEERNIIVIKKISHISPKYPRASSKISKAPLK